eukprot:15971662-Heterocapsa_arctica.AAC.1
MASLASDAGSSRPQSASGLAAILREAAGALAVIHPAQGAAASASASTHLPSPREAAPSPAGPERWSMRPGQAT